MKLFGKILAGLVALIVLLIAVAYIASAGTVGKRFTVTDPAPPIPTDSASIARGKHFARAITKCVACHGDDLGGEVMIDNLLLGRVASVNLTRGTGGRGDSLTDAQIVTAIRHGVGGDGRALYIMPSATYQYRAMTMWRRLSHMCAACLRSIARNLCPGSVHSGVLWSLPGRYNSRKHSRSITRRSDNLSHQRVQRRSTASTL